MPRLWQVLAIIANSLYVWSSWPGLAMLLGGWREKDWRENQSSSHSFRGHLPHQKKSETQRDEVSGYLIALSQQFVSPSESWHNRRSLGSRVKRPGFKSQLLHLAVWAWANCLTSESQFPLIWNGGNCSAYLKDRREMKWDGVIWTSALQIIMCI